SLAGRGAAVNSPPRRTRMDSTLLMLTATWIVGAPLDAPADKAPPPVVQPAVSAPAGAATTPSKPTLGQRLRNFFLPPWPETAARPQAPLLEPREVHTAPVAARTTTAPTLTTVKVLRPGMELAEKELQKVGHEQDYSWITGKLFRAPGGGDHWVLRYGG